VEPNAKGFQKSGRAIDFFKNYDRPFPLKSKEIGGFFLEIKMISQKYELPLK
jgi:hypothetical protein